MPVRSSDGSTEGVPSRSPVAGLRFGIFADDLTGALDAAAPFAVRGLSAYASLTPRLPLGLSLGYVTVVSVNMDSRRLTSAQAAERAYAAVSELVERGYRPAFNKVDSTLRGHTGLEALVAARSGVALGLLVCPAFPANGRTVVGGQLLVDGIRVERTDVGQDPLTPVTSSDVSEAIRRNTGVVPEHIGLEAVRGGHTGVARILKRCGEAYRASRGIAAVVADAETDFDLGILARAGLIDEPDWLLAGSAGLAKAVAAQLAPVASGVARPVSARPPFLIVVGSQRKVAAESVRSLLRSDRARLVMASGRRLLEDGEATGEIYGAARSAIGHLRSGRSAVLVLDASESLEGLRGSEDARARLSAARDRLVAGFGEIAAEALGAARPGALVVVGGDTATGVLTAAGAAGIFLHDEPLPGAAAGILDGGDFAGLPVVTKAGALGDAGTLSTLQGYLEQGDATT